MYNQISFEIIGIHPLTSPIICALIHTETYVVAQKVDIIDSKIMPN